MEVERGPGTMTPRMTLLQFLFVTTLVSYIFNPNSKVGHSSN